MVNPIPPRLFEDGFTGRLIDDMQVLELAGRHLVHCLLHLVELQAHEKLLLDLVVVSVLVAKVHD